ncbi:DUF4270 family protein [Parafilimonas sp.]|uniref:DUF4270 family protein n=1 Tax=Parafilimonas sp. TaxID=1969739 RepID=UPI0039E51C45
MNCINRTYRYILALSILASGFFSCEKKEVDFGVSALTDDPNIATIDTISVNAYTTQVDSFSTVTTGYFVAGNHYDSVMGNLQATAYFDFTIPYDSTSALDECTSCYFDSLVLITQFAGGFYGDTTAPFTLNVNQLTQLIYDYNTFGYNVTSRTYNSEPLGSFTGIVSPAKLSTIRIKLSDDLGQDIYNKIKRESDTITTSDVFLKYIKGFCLTGSSASNTIYYMKPTGDSDLVVLYYHQNAPLPVSRTVKLPLNTAHQFNGFVADHSGTNLSVFTAKKTQAIESSKTGGYVYMQANHGLYPKFNFPSIYSLKEVNDYVSVVSAVLEVYPLQGSYGLQSFYKLPAAINLDILNEYDAVSGYVYYSGTSTLQTGDLYVDYLYNENTKYTYDITSYVNAVLEAGTSSTYYLYMQPASGASDSTEQRLVLQALNNSSFKLKLSVLGL